MKPSGLSIFFYFISIYYACSQTNLDKDTITMPKRFEDITLRSQNTTNKKNIISSNHSSKITLSNDSLKLKNLALRESASENIISTYLAPSSRLGTAKNLKRLYGVLAGNQRSTLF